MKYLIKIVLVLVILLLLTMLRPTIAPALNTILGILVNMFIATGLAYVSFPMVKFLKKKGMNNLFASFLTLLTFLSIFVIAGTLIVQLAYPQIIRAIELIQKSPDGVAWIRANPSLNKAYEFLLPYFDVFSKQAMDYFANFTRNLITGSTKFIGDAALIISLYLYILFDSEKIVTKIKKRLKAGSYRYNFVKELNKEYQNYLRGVAIIFVITIIEYGIIYYVIGHPDWIALTALCAFSNFIPYFGGIIVNLIALATSVFVNPFLFVKVLVCIIVFPTLEGNVINPMVHKKTTRISPIVLLPSIFIGNSIFGLLGIVLSIPAIIFFKVFKKHYKEQVLEKLHKAWIS